MKSKTKTIKKVLGLALSLSICASFIPCALTANAEESDYTITIPAALTVTDSGWNAIGDISATGTLASGKKLTVTAESANNWALVSGQNSVSYTLCNSTMSLEKGDAATSWDFTELNNEPNRKFIGIDVADYSEKPAGTYEDTVTFTASVEEAGPTLATALENGATVTVDYHWNSAQNKHTYFNFTNNNGTYTCSITGDDTGNFTGKSLTKSGNTLIFAVTHNMSDLLNLTINFDTTNNTYQITQKGSLYVSFAISVNGTGITSQLSEVN